MAENYVLWPAARSKYGKPISLVPQNRPERFMVASGSGFGRITLRTALLHPERGQFDQVMDFFDPHAYGEDDPA